MITLKDLKKGIELQSIKNYILVSDNGTIAAQDSLEMTRHAGFISSCGKQCLRFGESRIRYLVFTVSRDTTLLIVPAGRHFIGISCPGDGIPESLINQVLSVTKIASPVSGQADAMPDKDIRQ